MPILDPPPGLSTNPPATGAATSRRTRWLVLAVLVAEARRQQPGSDAHTRCQELLHRWADTMEAA